MNATEKLKSLASRINRLMDERDSISGDIRDVFQEVKSAGFNAPALRKVVAAMRMNKDKREELEFDIGSYRAAVGLDGNASLDEQPRVVAAKMLAEGAGVRQTARATGVKKSTVSDLSGKLKNKKIPDTKPHDIETGEITEPPAGATPQEASVNNAEAAPHSSGAVSAGDEMPAMPAHLRRGTAENDAARGRV